MRRFAMAIVGMMMTAGLAWGQGMPKLPVGHPDIATMRAPTTQAVKGTITVKAVHKTAGGPAISGDPVSVDFWRDGRVFSKLEGKLDASGIATFADVLISTDFQPSVRITHAGVEFETDGQVMDPAHATQQIEAAVYETTAIEPKWAVKMRHVMIESNDEGAHVMEVLAVENPTDRAWTGKTTLSLTLPVTAKDVELGGFRDGFVAIDGNHVTNTMPMMPGVTQYQVNYIVPATGSKAEITATAPALVKQMMVFVSQDGSSVSAQGLKSMGVVNMGQDKVRAFQGSDLEAGNNVKLTISDIRSGTTEVSSTPSTSGIGATQIVQSLAGVGAVLILLFGGAFLVMKPVKNPKRSAA